MTTEDNKVRIGSVIKRPWGYYRLLEQKEDYSVKILYINPGEETSTQRHSKRNELITLLDGEITITHNDYTFTKGRGHQASSYRIRAGDWHKFASPEGQDKITVILEVAYGELDPDDFQRSEDKYNRERKEGSGFVKHLIVDDN